MTDDMVAAEMGEEQDFDGCDIDFNDAEATPDEELPMTVGGIGFEDEGDDACGCDVEIDDLDATPDDELPITEGGVA